MKKISEVVVWIMISYWNKDDVTFKSCGFKACEFDLIVISSTFILIGKYH